ncbi:MAG: PQQ-binding-like beta-propeller repeat protein [Planctomycetaceae bacterium]|nr:PQQ-binding-like beta-propeller repeat protein [Planctomycetaceae bacterium]
MRLTGLLVLTFMLSSARAGDRWPEFRGPTADGRADDTGLPVTWSENENIAWKTAIQGRAWSSPVIWGDRIWLTTASGDGHELSYLVLDTNSGEVIRDELLFHTAIPQENYEFNSHASPTPVLDEQRAYLCWGSAGTACIDRETFDVLWTRRDLECDHYRGSGSSPILYDDMLICHYDGFDYQYVIALDTQTGDTVWKTPRPTDFGTTNGDHKKAYGTPIVIDVNGQTQLFSPSAKGAFAYDAHTGEEIWRIRFDQHSIACRPLYEQGTLFLTTGFGRAEMLAVDPTGQGDVTDTHILWRKTKGMPSKPSPLYIDGLLYLIHDQGVAMCLDTETGDEVWKHRLGGNYSASPVYADGRIYVFSEEGDATVLATGREAEVLAQNKLDAGCLASPAIANGALFVRTRTHLYRIGESSR